MLVQCVAHRIDLDMIFDKIWKLLIGVYFLFFFEASKKALDPKRFAILLDVKALKIFENMIHSN
jgi:hypothetical protein